MVQLPGDDYNLTIVPDNTGATVTMTDNGVDVTSNLGYKEVETVKEGVTSTTVNYTYSLSNIQTGHTLSVNISSGQMLYLKRSGSWVQVRSIYKKENGNWVDRNQVLIYLMKTLFILKKINELLWQRLV